jgi:chemotaxis protein MotB
MPRRKRHEEHINHEAWAIPYGDLVTLLLAFFVVMYAISSINEGKYRVLSDSLFAAFRGAPRTMQPIQVGEKQVGSGADIKTTIVEQAMIDGQPRSLLAPVPVKTGMPQPSSSDSSGNLAATARARALQQVADQVARAMDDLVKANLVVVRRTDFWIEVEIRTDILFPSASAQLESQAVGVIEKLGEALAPYPNPIRVEGHTDNRPIKTLTFISNWELSAARAGSVVRVLASKGVSPNRLAVIGYGENRPSQSNDTMEGRNANRRVIVVILSADAASALSPTAKPADAQAVPAGGAAPGAPESTPAPGTPVEPAVPLDLATAPAATPPSETATTLPHSTAGAPGTPSTAAAPNVTSVAPSTAIPPITGNLPRSTASPQ